MADLAEIITRFSGSYIEKHKPPARVRGILALEGQLGFFGVLHTWDRKLGYHPHLHVLIAAGALSADRARFQTLKSGRWLFPVKALSTVFRGIYLDNLKALHKAGSLKFRGAADSFSSAEGFTRIRFYGFWSNSLKGRCLPLIRRHLGCEPGAEPDEQRSPDWLVGAEFVQHICPQCGSGPLLPSQRLPPSTGPPIQPCGMDTENHRHGLGTNQQTGLSGGPGQPIRALPWPAGHRSDPLHHDTFRIARPPAHAPRLRSTAF